MLDQQWCAGIAGWAASVAWSFFFRFSAKMAVVARFLAGQAKSSADSIGNQSPNLLIAGFQGASLLRYEAQHAPSDEDKLLQQFDFCSHEWKQVVR